MGNLVAVGLNKVVIWTYGNISLVLRWCVCEKDITSSYHMRISLTGNMHVGLIIIKDGESKKELIGERPGEN